MLVFVDCIPIPGAGRARLTGVVYQHDQAHATISRHLVAKLPLELAPAPVANGSVKVRCLLYDFAVLLIAALGRPGHVPYLQTLTAYECVILADRHRNVMQEIFVGVSHAGVDLLDPGLRLLPVVTEFDCTAHAALVAREALLVFLKTVERCNQVVVTHGGKLGYTDIDTDDRYRDGKRLFDSTLRLDDVATLAQHIACCYGSAANSAWARRYRRSPCQN